MMDQFDRDSYNTQKANVYRSVGSATQFGFTEEAVVVK